MQLTSEDFAFLWKAMMDRDPSAGEVDVYYAMSKGIPSEVVSIIAQQSEFIMKHPSFVPKPIYADLLPAVANGVEVLVPPNDWVHWGTKQGMGWEPHVAEAIRQYLKPGGVFIDIGANTGVLTMLGASIVGDAGQVYAVEASIEVAMVLLANVRHAKLTNTFVLPRAVTDTTRIEQIMVGHGTTNRFVRTEQIDLKKFNFEPILTDTIDSMLSHLNRVDLIKIDVEGREGSALRGAAKLLDRTKPAIIAEYHYSSDEYYFADELIARGYEVSLLDIGKQPIAFGQDHAALREHGKANSIVFNELLFTLPGHH